MPQSGLTYDDRKQLRKLGWGNILKRAAARPDPVERDEMLNVDEHVEGSAPLLDLGEYE